MEWNWERIKKTTIQFVILREWETLKNNFKKIKAFEKRNPVKGKTVNASCHIEGIEEEKDESGSLAEESLSRNWTSFAAGSGEFVKEEKTLTLILR